MKESLASPPSVTLNRELRLADAVWLGLGSILGTGIFVSLGLAAGVAGPSVIIAILLAAVVATLNALSSAQLAAAHAVSGGTYEYGYHFLRPLWGFLAGWVFLLAKSASAATAALGLAGYICGFVGSYRVSPHWIGCGLVLMMTSIVLLGARRTSRVNTVVVSITLLSLCAFVLAAGYVWATSDAPSLGERFFPVDGFRHRFSSLLQATALMFVAYTGYGRIATLAEEVAEPRRVIPKAIIATLCVSAVVYFAVAVAVIATVGPHYLYKAAVINVAPLSSAARTFDLPWLPPLLAVGAATAMLGVLLNLILGLSRVVLAMGRRADLPQAFARLSPVGRTPTLAVAGVGLAIALLALFGSISTTWRFSAFTVLVYYAITNAAALAMPVEQRIFPRWISAVGLTSCFSLLFFLDSITWFYAVILMAAGTAWFGVARLLQTR